MTKIGIITGSTRNARVNAQVVDFITERAKQNTEAEFEIIDIKDYDFELFNADVPPAMANKQYEDPKTRKWSEKVEELDGFIFVSPEYNNAVTPSLKNAIDYLGSEWSNKAAGIVTYGSTLGIAAQLNLRNILANVNIAVVGPAGAFSLFTDFEEMSTFTPQDVHNDTIQAVVDNTVAWSKALESVRN